MRNHARLYAKNLQVTHYKNFGFIVMSGFSFCLEHVRSKGFEVVAMSELQTDNRRVGNRNYRERLCFSRTGGREGGREGEREGGREGERREGKR